MDKDDSFNSHCGPIYAETCAGLVANNVNVKGINYIYGLGGRDVKVESIKTVFTELEKIIKEGKLGDTYRYLEVRE
jgi:pyruvate ferredoxin oxidoreductase alpha subunit